MESLVSQTKPPNIVFYKHPLLSTKGAQHIYLTPLINETLSKFLYRSKIRWQPPIGIYINDQKLTINDLDRVIKPQDQIIIRSLMQGGGGDSDIISTVLTIAVLAYAPGLGESLGAALGASATVGTAIATMGGMLLISAITPLPEPAHLNQSTSAASSPTYSLQGSRNQIRKGQPLILVCGKHRVYPDHGVKPYSKRFVSNEQFLDQVFHWGMYVQNPVISDLKIGDTALSSYQDASHTDANNLKLNLVDSLSGSDLEIETWVERSTPINTKMFEVDIVGQLFRIDKDGNSSPLSARFNIEYRITGQTLWTPVFFSGLTYLTLTHSERSPIRHTVEKELDASDQFDIRIKLMGVYQLIDQNPINNYDEFGEFIDVTIPPPLETLVDVDSNNRLFASLSWSQLRSIELDDTDYSHQYRSLLNIKASGQLNGSIDAFNAIVSNKCLSWSGNEWSITENSNPAWWFLAIARGMANADGLRLYGALLEDSAIDIEAIKLWGLWCDSKNLACNIVFDTPQNVFSMLSIIAKCGRAAPTWQSGKLAAIWDEANLPSTAVFGMGNIIRESFDINYLGNAQVDEVIVEFINEETGYQLDQVRQSVPGIVNPKSPVTVRLPGITSEAQAGKEANLIAAEQIYRRRIVSFKTDMEGLTVNRGDVVTLSHDLTNWGYSGRLVSAMGDQIILDRKVPFTDGQTHYIGIRSPSGSYLIHDVIAQSGEADVLTLVNTLLQNPDDDIDNQAVDYTWVFEPSATPGKKVKITDIRPLSEHQVQITATDEDDDFYLKEIDNYGYQYLTGYIDDVPSLSSLKVTPKLIKQGNSFAAKLHVTWDVHGGYELAIINAKINDQPEQEIGRTFQQFFEFDAPYIATIELNVVGLSAIGNMGPNSSLNVTLNYNAKDFIPPDPLGLNVVVLSSGIRQLSPLLPYIPDNLKGYNYRARLGIFNTWDELSTENGGVNLHTTPIQSNPFETPLLPSGTYSIGVKLIDIDGDESEQEFINQYSLSSDPKKLIDAAELAAITAAALDATSKANAAEAAAISTAATAAQAKADLAQTTAESYADGVVSAEETRAIADAKDKADAAESAAITAAALDATSKANAAKLSAISTAAIAAQTKANLAQVTAQAHADSLVTAEETRAIADAKDKADAAELAAITAAAFDATSKANAAALVADWSNVSQTANAPANNATENNGALADLNSVASNHINTSAVTTTKIANLAISEAKIANLAVTTSKIKDLSVDTLKIKDQAVTIPVTAYTQSAVNLTASNAWVTVQSFSIAGTGNPSFIFASVALKGIPRRYEDNNFGEYWEASAKVRILNSTNNQVLYETDYYKETFMDSLSEVNFFPFSMSCSAALSGLKTLKLQVYSNFPNLKNGYPSSISTGAYKQRSLLYLEAKK